MVETTQSIGLEEGTTVEIPLLGNDQRLYPLTLRAVKTDERTQLSIVGPANYRNLVGETRFREYLRIADPSSCELSDVHESRKQSKISRISAAITGLARRF